MASVRNDRRGLWGEPLAELESPNINTQDQVNDVGGKKEVVPETKDYERLIAPEYAYSAGQFGYGPFNYDAFSYKDQALLDAAKDRATNFTYDPSNDNAYQTYAREYMRNGADAYRNSMARLASRTGGVGSSYAVQAAQGAYNNYMQQLADKVPELRELAYQKAKDAYDVYQNDYDRAYNMYNNERNFAYDQYQDARDIAYKNFQLQEAAREAAYKQNYNRQLDAYNQKVTDAAKQSEASNYEKYLDQLVADNVLTREQAADALERYYYGDTKDKTDNATQNKNEPVPSNYATLVSDIGYAMDGGYKGTAKNLIDNAYKKKTISAEQRDGLYNYINRYGSTGGQKNYEDLWR